MNIDWNHELIEQLDWWWNNHLRARLDGLTDEEYFWEPSPGCWSVRRREESTAPRAVGSGDFVFEYAYSEPDPAPVTTIAWLLGHLSASVFGERNAWHFNGPQVDFATFHYAGTAKEARDQLDTAYACWITGMRSLGDEGLSRPCGPAEGPYSEYPLAALVLHTNREFLHHTAEITRMRDLYLWRNTA